MILLYLRSKLQTKKSRYFHPIQYTLESVKAVPS